MDEPYSIAQEDGLLRYEIAIPEYKGSELEPGEPRRIPPFIAVSAEIAGKRYTEVLKTKCLRGDYGNQIGVSKKSPFREGTQPLVAAATEREYKIFRLLNDPRHKLPLYGLAIALVGILLKASMDLGQIAALPKIYVHSSLYAFSTVLAYLIQGAGLIIAFLTGVIKIED